MRPFSLFRSLSVGIAALLFPLCGAAQELNCKVTVDYQQIQGTNTSIFSDLEEAVTSFMNERRFTVQSNRPVYASNYTTPVLNLRDREISFTYHEFDQLEFRLEQIDNNLTALLAYYAYLIIGFDMDTMAPMGGTSVLQNAEAIVNAAQSFTESGWKAYDDNRNRHGILTDYMDESMKPFRQMMYDYHRLGLDDMAGNVGRGRAQVTTALEELDAAAQAKSMSALPQIFTEAKRDELINVYSEAPSSEKEKVYELLSDLNPSLKSDWDKIKSTSTTF